MFLGNYINWHRRAYTNAHSFIRDESEERIYRVIHLKTRSGLYITLFS